MEINKTIIDRVKSLSKTIEEKNQIASELLKVAKDRFGETELDIERNIKGKGQVVKAKQKDLWEEVFRLGDDSEAARVLKVKHKPVFDAFIDVNKTASELNLLAVTQLGLQAHNRVTLTDIINLAEGIAEYKIKAMVEEAALVPPVDRTVGDSKPSEVK